MTDLVDIELGTMLGKYEILRKIATGGMAVIYLARVRGVAGFEKLVVIKRILPEVADDPRFVTMFLDEARLVASLQHPNIADVHEVGEAAGAPYFAMELVHGHDVRQIRAAANARGQAVPIGVSLAIAHAVASALDYAHQRTGPDGAPVNLVHRDVSASNVLVSYEGAIKLIDFGIARASNKNATTKAGTVKGKFPYMSPEQCVGMDLDRRSDLFSLGVVVYELTVGRRPFDGPNEHEIMRMIVQDAPRPPSKVVPGYPPELEPMVMKLLARKRSDRYQSADEFLRDLDPFLDNEKLWIAPHRMSRYMRALFADRIAQWEAARAGDVETAVEQIAQAMAPADREAKTVPTPLPIVMQLSKILHEVSMDTERSIQPMRKVDFDSDSSARRRVQVLTPPAPVPIPAPETEPEPENETITVRQNELDMTSVGPRAADTVTSIGEPDEDSDEGDTGVRPDDTGVRPDDTGVRADESDTTGVHSNEGAAGDTITLPIGATIDTVTVRTSIRAATAAGARVETTQPMKVGATPKPKVETPPPKLRATTELGPAVPPPTAPLAAVVAPASAVMRAPVSIATHGGLDDQTNAFQSFDLPTMENQRPSAPMPTAPSTPQPRATPAPFLKAAPTTVVVKPRPMAAPAPPPEPTNRATTLRSILIIVAIVVSAVAAFVVYLLVSRR